MTVAVGEATHAATVKVFAFDACHAVTLKGKSRPLRAWIATAPLARTGSELRTFSSAFVGREEELTSWRSCSRRSQRGARRALPSSLASPESARVACWPSWPAASTTAPSSSPGARAAACPSART